MDPDMSDESRREVYKRMLMPHALNPEKLEQVAEHMLDAYLNGRGDGLRAADMADREHENVFQFEPNEDSQLTCLSCFQTACDKAFVLRSFGRISTIGIHSFCVEHHIRATRARRVAQSQAR